MSTLITVSGVRGYIDENGTAWLEMDAIARGLGFTEVKNHVEYVRYRTIYAHLESLGLSQDVAKEGFIPENVFYLLAMKASNQTAISYQAKVANEILPSIRKTGSYSVKPQSIEDLIILQAQSVKEIRLTQQQQATAIADHEFKLADIDQKVTNEITLTTREQKQIQGAVNSRAKYLGSPDSYRQIYGALKKYFCIPSYRDLKRSDLGNAFRVIGTWSPAK